MLSSLNWNLTADGIHLADRIGDEDHVVGALRTGERPTNNDTAVDVAETLADAGTDQTLHGAATIGISIQPVASEITSVVEEMPTMLIEAMLLLLPTLRPLPNPTLQLT